MSNQISQKDAVVNEVKSILGSSFDPSAPAKDQLSKSQIEQIKSNISEGIIDGTISYNKDTSDDKEIRKYVNGMVSNHFRKTKELNGNSTYVPQSSGRGSRDSQISELSKLLKTFDEGSSEYDQVLTAISARKAELASVKAEQQKERKKQKELESINTDALPDSLKELANTLVGNVSN